jgi:hypothetical protein
MALSPSVVAATSNSGSCASASLHELEGRAAERYLLYSPQFGLSNQLVALRNAVVWAILLNRTLVVPHLLGHAKGTPRAEHGHAFSLEGADKAVPPLRFIEMEPFLRLGLRPSRRIAFETRTMYSRSSTEYWTAMGRRGSWDSATQLDVPMAVASPAAIRATFGGCRASVLGFVSMFGALQVAEPREYPPPGLEWLNRIAMPALLGRLSPELDRVARIIVARLAPALVPGVAVSSRLACVHIRRGDFVAECAKYDRELASGSARGWVVSHFRKGWSCLQSDEELAANLGALRVRSRPSAFYASVEDPSLLAAPVLRQFNLSSLAHFRGTLDAARLEVANEIAHVLIDQRVCAASPLLLLNAFSTFSQMVMGRVGLGHPAIGWARDLNALQQKRAGVRVEFLKQKRVLS